MLDMRIDGIEGVIELIDGEKINELSGKRLTAYYLELVRMKTGMNRKEFADWLHIPYRTITDWERAERQMPNYVLELIVYKVNKEFSGDIKTMKQ